MEHSDMNIYEINGESYFAIKNVNRLRPFFMSIVSASDHWMFISSNGGLTAGRKNSDHALFPYYTDDKLTASADSVGPITILRIQQENKQLYWQPFNHSLYSPYEVSNNLYKSVNGSKIVFEEINHNLQLTFKYQWSLSEHYGFIRSSTISNHNSGEVAIKVLDGVQNILPANVNEALQNTYSNLVDAYKRSELEESSGIGIYALSAQIVDRAEPSESLLANVVWQIGFPDKTELLSTRQINDFLNGGSVKKEIDVNGEKGAYVSVGDMKISGSSEETWYTICDVNYDQADIIHLAHQIRNESDFLHKVLNDVKATSEELNTLVAAADGLSLSNDKKKDARHFSNVLFNIMRGGVMDDNYTIDKGDLIQHILRSNRIIYNAHKDYLDELLPDKITQVELKKLKTERADSDLSRIVTEYLPLKFSRRHGDPSRPWNKFSINLKDKNTGKKVLDYQGNWRDIFQNWEALSYSYPRFILGMIYRFLNASTFDGYNPYRVTKSGFDWEIIEPDDPWSYIGYWGDHQVIYLLKLLECLSKHDHELLHDLFDRAEFVYAAVPYRIKPYENIIADPNDTIKFDQEWHNRIVEYRDQIGSDGALLNNKENRIHQVTFIEKILAMSLAKITNLIPEGGIWMNTQRPEWNDANNALVGNGISMVTLYYLHRFFIFFENLLSSQNSTEASLSSELFDYFHKVLAILKENESKVNQGFSPSQRQTFCNELGQTASHYRIKIYDRGFSSKKQQLDLRDITSYISLCLRYIKSTIKVNQRNDGLYHSYNILDIREDGFHVSHLDEMLEGQVAILSGGYLTSSQIVQVLKSLRLSSLYRKDQNSYILYPNRNIAGFLEKNNLSADDVENNSFLKNMIQKGDTQIIKKDINGDYHFNSSFRNKYDVLHTLNEIKSSGLYKVSDSNEKSVLAAYEKVFNHKEFTGRSGTFFGYEGLGSIYWHMVSKLLLAVQECYYAGKAKGDEELHLDAIKNSYYDIYEGLGIHKTPELYGSFPTDPYSHTPAGKGAQQPGMTGQVKEDILSRFGELGILVENSQITINTDLICKKDFLERPSVFTYYDLFNTEKSIELEKNSLAFTYCQIPFIYNLGTTDGVDILFKNGEKKTLPSLNIPIEESAAIFDRSGTIDKIVVRLSKVD